MLLLSSGSVVVKGMLERGRHKKEVVVAPNGLGEDQPPSVRGPHRDGANTGQLGRGEATLSPVSTLLTADLRLADSHGLDGSVAF